MNPNPPAPRRPTTIFRSRPTPGPGFPFGDPLGPRFLYPARVFQPSRIPLAPRGLTVIYTTCRRCRDLLSINADEHGDFDTVHPLCEPKPTRIERLSAELQVAVEADDRDAEQRIIAELDKLDAQPPELLRTALHYAGYGWPVFP